MISIGMGTENSSKVLASLIKMLRPLKIIEIGAGYSTIVMLNSIIEYFNELKNDINLSNNENWSERLSIILPPNKLENIPIPKLISIDDGMGEGSSANKVWEIIENNPAYKMHSEIIKKNFYHINMKDIQQWGKIDLIWLDAGTLVDDAFFLNRLTPQLSEGGIIALHEPFFTSIINNNGNKLLRSIRTPLWEEISKHLSDQYEIISLTENHKYRQSGLGLIRKKTKYELIYRKESFQEEMLIVNQAPILPDFGDITKKNYHPISILKNKANRIIYSAIQLEFNSIEKIKQITFLDIKTIEKSLKSLTSYGLIYNENKIFKLNDIIWEKLPSNSQKNKINIYHKDILDKIISNLNFNEIYSEQEISSFCSMFDRDFATLRRTLIDLSYLKRDNNGNYKRIN
ncbi:DUF2087 domain-containing protein [Gallibacterium anatis]|uniref:DUF2087 domain-containing protein n=1 Tax=Gallibacterium anatis TaxID=750 RepID=UPI003006201C